jgi:hypothetical protein
LRLRPVAVAVVELVVVPVAKEEPAYAFVADW